MKKLILRTRLKMYICLHVKYPSDFNELEFSRQIFEKTHVSNFMKICPLGAELFHADTHGEADSRFLQFCDGAK